MRIIPANNYYSGDDRMRFEIEIKGVLLGGLTHLVRRHKGQRHLGVIQRAFPGLERDVGDNGVVITVVVSRLQRGFAPARSIFNS